MTTHRASTRSQSGGDAPRDASPRPPLPAGRRVAPSRHPTSVDVHLCHHPCVPGPDGTGRRGGLRRHSEHARVARPRLGSRRGRRHVPRPAALPRHPRGLHRGPRGVVDGGGPGGHRDADAQGLPLERRGRVHEVCAGADHWVRRVIRRYGPVDAGAYPRGQSDVSWCESRERV